MQSLPREEHEELFKGYMERMRGICKFLGIRFSVIPLAWFWRHRFRAIVLTLRAVDKALHHPSTGDFEIGEKIQLWRKGSYQKHMITRACLTVSLETRNPITLSNVESFMDGAASRENIRAALNHGVDCGIYDKTEQRSKSTKYTLTLSAVREMTERAFCKLTSAELIEWAKFVVAFDEMRRQSHQTYVDEEKGLVNKTDHQGLLEAIFWGPEGRRNAE